MCDEWDRSEINASRMVQSMLTVGVRDEWGSGMRRWKTEERLNGNEFSSELGSGAQEKPHSTVAPVARMCESMLAIAGDGWVRILGSTKRMEGRR